MLFTEENIRKILDMRRRRMMILLIYIIFMLKIVHMNY